MHFRQEEERLLAQSRCGMQRSIPAALLDSDECDCALLRSRTVTHATEEKISDRLVFVRGQMWQGPPRARLPVWAVEQGLCKAHVGRSHGAPSPQQRARRGSFKFFSSPFGPRRHGCHVDECRCAASFSGTFSGWYQERGCCQVRATPCNFLLAPA